MFITLLDPSDGKKYTIDVSINDARRAEKDVYFAQELLDQCKKQDQNQLDATIETSEQLEEQELLQRNIWSYSQTQSLIASVENHYEDLLHANPQIKKRAWENVSNDLLSSKYIATSGECKKKWSNLVQSYKKAKDLKGKTGRGPTRFNFYENIDNILGLKPSNCSPHTVDVGKMSCENKENSDELTINMSETELYDAHSSNDVLSSNSESLTPILKNKRKRKYISEKEERKMREEKKEKQFQQKMKLKEKKLELEERKVKALEEYIALKKSNASNFNTN